MWLDILLFYFFKICVVCCTLPRYSGCSILLPKPIKHANKLVLIQCMSITRLKGGIEGRGGEVHILSDTVIIGRRAYLASLFACISVYSLHYIYLFVYGTLQYHLFSSSSQKKKCSRTFEDYFGIFYICHPF
jgi:hypothetical protein